MIRRRAEDRIDSFFLLQHYAEIFVRRTRELRIFGAVLLLDLRFDWPAAGLAFVIERLKIPLLRGVGNCNDARVLLGEKPAEIRAALATRADQRDVHHFAGSDMI